MCLIAFAWQAHPEYPLIVAANRDEFFARPTAQADWWPDGRIVAGRDLRGGGTWMGVSRGGRFAALTNYRDPAAFRPEAPSRGELVGRFLSANDGDGALASIARDAARYNGFNLLAARWDQGMSMAIVSPGAAGPAPIAAGIHGLSNAHLDTAWPKVDAVVAGLTDAVDEAFTSDALTDRLFTMMSDRRIASDDRLPATGIPLDFERALSAPFIRVPGYGTRSSAVLLVDRSGTVTFVERRCEPDEPVGERRFSFATEARAS